MVSESGDANNVVRLYAISGHSLRVHGKPSTWSSLANEKCKHLKSMEALPQRVKAPLILVFIAPCKVMLWLPTAATLGLFDFLVS